MFLYWDSEKRCYMPAPTDDKSGSQSKVDDSNKDDKKKDKDKDKGQDKVKVAKRIAKVCNVFQKIFLFFIEFLY